MKSQLKKVMDLTDWTYLFTFGHSLDVYAFGRLRIVIDSKTGIQVISYRGPASPPLPLKRTKGNGRRYFSEQY